MGLTTGICDAAGLADSLIGVLRKNCAETLLTTYADVRRQKYLDVTDKVSYSNTCLLRDTCPATAHEVDFFKTLRESPEGRRGMLESAYRLG